MKKIILTLIAAVVCSCSVFAQTTSKETRKALIAERNNAVKLAANALNAKVSKDAKKQAKAMAKDGWKPAPGSPSLEKQLNELNIKRYTMDASGLLPKFIIGSITGKGSQMAYARKQAMALAQVEIAEQIEAEVAELIENSTADKLLDNGEAETLVKSMSASKTLVQQKLGRNFVGFEAYREVNGKFEYQVSVIYSSDQAKSDLVKAFESQSKEMQEKLMKVLEK